MASSSLASSPVQWKYDVFLSFRGEDTRKNFTDHVYAALDQKGIFTFRDDEELERGKEIKPELLSAIEESRFSIIVLSKNYASSTWCLDELCKIIDCIKKKHHMAFPIFYDVDPREVRNQRGDFKKAFDKHEKDFKDSKEKVERWRSALAQVANLSGWHLQDRHESKLIQEIVKEISERLDRAFPIRVPEDLVGMESRMEEIKPYLKPRSDDVRFIGIWGMGGLGKTTIARVVYNWLLDQYESCCFLANIREVSTHSRGIISLQNQLLSEVLPRNKFNIRDVHKGVQLISSCLCRKKVLLVLDDVHQPEQLNALAGAPEWFGSGSRIIILTRDEHLLIRHGVQYIYKVKGLNNGEAMTLFHLKAFKHKQPEVGHFELSTHVVSYAQGLPLALEVLGSFLRGRSVEQWKSTLDRLQKHPEETIFEVLRISYDGLQRTEKEIFLDIACFFKGKDKDRVIEILDCCDFDPNIGIKLLIEKSLLTILNNKLWMHDLLQVMGWEIVREKNPRRPSEWSRLWLSKDIYRVLQEDKGTDAIEGIILDPPKKETRLLNSKSLSNMTNLRLLQISNFQLSKALKYLSNELRILNWHGYPSKSFPLSFYPENLFELIMCYSNIEYLWEGIKSFEKLKSIDMSHSCKLTKTPDFTKIPNIVQLNLEGCTGLLEVHESVGALKRLTILNLKDCENLLSLPNSFSGLKSLKFLYLCGCSKLEKLPQDIGKVECLEELDVSGTAISQVPSSIALLGNLKKLSFHRGFAQASQTRKLSPHSLLMPKRHPNSISLLLPSLIGLFCLRTLDLGYCNLFNGVIPSDIGSLSSLEELNLSRSNIVSLPESIKQLLKLRILCLEDCEKLQSLPELPTGIIFVGAENCTLLDVETLSSALKRTTSTLIALHFFNCSNLVDNCGRKDSLEIMLLKRWLQDLSIQSSQFHICVPGSEIPKWFNDWSNWYSDYSVETRFSSSRLHELLGFAVCAVFAVPGYSYESPPVIISCLLSIASVDYNFEFAINSSATIKSDHLWLGYFSSKLFLTSDIPTGITYVCATIHISSEGTMIPIDTVKRCGIRVVYKQDVGFLESHYNFKEASVMEGPSSSSIPSASLNRRPKRSLVPLPRILTSDYFLQKFLRVEECADCLLGTMKATPVYRDRRISRLDYHRREKFLRVEEGADCLLGTMKATPVYRDRRISRLDYHRREYSLEMLQSVDHFRRDGDLYSLSELIRLLLNSGTVRQIPSSVEELRTHKILYLGYCHILDGAIFTDIGFFSSLEELDLSGNHFISLPNSIKQLLKLQILYLRNCRKLQSLPELPPAISLVEAENCTSLDVETLSSSFKQSNASDITLKFFNCLRKLGNQGRINNLEAMLLKHWLKQVHVQASEFHIFLQGSEIPKWFSDCNDWHSVETQLPFSRFDDLLGFALCVVFSVPGRPFKNSAKIRCCLSIGLRDYAFEFNTPSTLKSDHLWLGYFASQLFLKQNWQLIVAKFYALYKYSESEDEIEDVKFIKKCGICPVYKQDVGYLESHNYFEEAPTHWIPSEFKNWSIRKFEFLPAMTEPRRAVSPDSRRRNRKRTAT